MKLLWSSGSGIRLTTHWEQPKLKSFTYTSCLLRFLTRPPNRQALVIVKGQRLISILTNRFSLRLLLQMMREVMMMMMMMMMTLDPKTSGSHEIISLLWKISIIISYVFYI